MGHMSKIYLFLIAFVVVASGAAGFWFWQDKTEEKTDKKSVKKDKLDIMQVTFFTLSPIIINLKSADERRHILKAVFVIESSRLEDKETITHLQPIILDQFQTYLRDLEMSDLQGATGLERIRQELFARVMTLTKPLGVEVRNILFKEFLLS